MTDHYGDLPNGNLCADYLGLNDDGAAHYCNVPLSRPGRRHIHKCKCGYVPPVKKDKSEASRLAGPVWHNSAWHDEEAGG